MAESQLLQYLKDSGISMADAARATGYAQAYVWQILNGVYPLTDSARMRFIRAFPETARFLLPEVTGVQS